MPDTPAFLAERLVRDGQKTILFFKNLPPEAWSKSIYTDGGNWTIHDILTHITISETSICDLIENIMAGGEGVSENFEIDTYHQQKIDETKTIDPSELLDSFSQFRKKTALLVESMTMADLERQGRHPFLGVTSLSNIIKLIYRHDQIHQRDIRIWLDELSSNSDH